MSQRTEPVRREYTDEGGQRIRTTSVTDKPAPRPGPDRELPVSEKWDVERRNPDPLT